jgi:DNA-binding transcriptional MerR regulator
MTIGRFARLTRLSVKQLRRYDELGLLAPASVDAETGYRFYHQRQARTAATVALLRELDVPLAVVRELLVADDERVAELLGAERARRAAELDRVARTLAALTQIANEGTLPEVQVSIRRDPPRRLAALRAPGDPERMSAVTAELATSMAALLPDPSVPFTALFPVDLPPAFDIVLGVDLADPPPGTEPLDLPGGPAASAVHLGPVDTISLSWWPLLAWVHERGLEPAGPIGEHYLDDHTTHLTVPLREE